jgi:DMSO/TMAO reductase YedYZ molybdopterin-dependent catalytic subunit
MRHPWANVLLLLLLAAQLASGFAGLINGSETAAWMLRVHDAGAFAILLLMFWKGRVVLASLQRRRAPLFERLGFLTLGVLLLGAIGTGLYWVFAGRTLISGYSVITLHVILALALIGLLAWHALAMRFIFGVDRAADRRAFLRLGALGIAGLALWQASEQLLSLLSRPGAARRFTGSYETGSFTGDFPVVSWLFDRPPPVDPAGWRLAVGGAVEHPLTLAYQDLERMATDGDAVLLDCTGGWYSTQQWEGIPIRRLLEMAGVKPEARSVTFEAVSGYSRRFELQSVGSFLLATRVAGEVLSHSHGFPARLVAPEYRGFEWVKWITRIEVDETPHYLQPPVPLQ